MPSKGASGGGKTGDKLAPPFLAVPLCGSCASAKCAEAVSQPNKVPMTNSVVASEVFDVCMSVLLLANMASQMMCRVMYHSEISNHRSNTKIVFQSFFISTTIHPRRGASLSASTSLPVLLG